LLGEVAYAMSQMLLMAKQRFILEAINLFLFNLIFVSLAIFKPELGALAYSLARLITALLWVVFSFRLLSKDHKSKNIQLLPDFQLKKLKDNQDQDYLKLVKAYYVQSVFKQILTEGERYLIAIFGLLSFNESGIYDLINNLGSLIARFVFLPIEDASYMYFTNTLKRGLTISEQPDASSSAKAKSYFELIIKIVSLIGLTVLVFGQSYSGLLLHIYGGTKLSGNSDCVNLLKFHCVYIYFLAINGVTEGFFNATMCEKGLKSHNLLLIVFSGIFLIATFLFANIYHVIGFLMANCLNMLVRIFVSTKHVIKFFSIPQQSEYKWQSVYFPQWRILLVFGISFLVTKGSESTLYENNYLFLHFVLGVFVFLFNLAAVLCMDLTLRGLCLQFMKKIKIA
jgi:oligosaccharide translocation protein RFT1